MSKPAVKKLPFDAQRVTRYRRTHTDDRYKNSDLTSFGPTFMVWDEEGSAGRFTINYEEVIYVVEGELTLTVYIDDQPEVITGAPGDVIAITKGSDLDYSGAKGTRIFVVFGPLNWEDLLEPTGSLIVAGV
jgi:ethanolamine utilization protein EutQ (cupin superfamily)